MLKQRIAVGVVALGTGVGMTLATMGTALAEPAAAVEAATHGEDWAGSRRDRRDRHRDRGRDHRDGDSDNNDSDASTDDHDRRPGDRRSIKHTNLNLQFIADSAINLGRERGERSELSRAERRQRRRARRFCRDAGFRTHRYIKGTLYTYKTARRNGRVHREQMREMGRVKMCTAQRSFMYPPMDRNPNLSHPTYAQITLNDARNGGLWGSNEALVVKAKGRCLVANNDLPRRGVVSGGCVLQLVDPPRGVKGGSVVESFTANPYGIEDVATRESFMTLQLFHRGRLFLP